MTNAEEEMAVPNTTGRVLHWALGYDLVAWAFCLGRERDLRERMLGFAELKLGERVLDIGCGTGTLGIAAKRCVGATGTVCGIDASPEMIARARKKASSNGVEVHFENAVVEKLPFEDASFDVVLSTLMLHHLGRKVRLHCLCEARRVLKPGGRLLAVDFAEPAGNRRSLLGHFHRHGYLKFSDLMSMLHDAGFSTVETGTLRTRNLYYASARVPLHA